MFFRSALLLCPVACLLAQTPQPPVPPLPPPPGQASPKPPLQPLPPKSSPPDRVVNPDGSVTMKLPIGAPLPQVPPEKVILTVGDLTITAQQFDEITDAVQDQYKAFVKGPGRKQFADQLAKILTLAQEGKRRKLDANPAFQSQVMYQTDQTLANFAFLAITKEVKLDDAALHAYYDAHKSEYEQLHARHILIRMKGSTVPVKPGEKDLTDEEALAKAQDLEKRIKAGEDFGKLAGAESDDAGSAINGGDVGTFGHGRMAPSFEEAAFKLAPGQVSEPVKSQFGYHIIKLESKDAKSFEAMKPEIEKKLAPEEAKKAMEAIEKNTKTVYDPEFFGMAKQ
jgi:peptidyl-prolyl cis-trans isomerase C